MVLIDCYSTDAFWFAVFAAAICRFNRLKYVPILRGGNLPHRIQNSKRISDYLFNGSLLNVATSRYLHECFNSHGYRSIIIHNYIELIKYPFTHRRMVSPRILWVRAFHSTYNPVMAINTFRIVQERFPDAKLCMVGPAKDGTMDMCKKVVNSEGLNVEFTGKLEKEKWIKMSVEYDIFINTTDYDNTPISVMEAMALGMPVVSTNPGGVSKLINDGVDGILVNTGDYESMADSIINLLTDHNKAGSISRAAREKAEMWDWNVVKTKWMDLINQ